MKAKRNSEEASSLATPLKSGDHWEREQSSCAGWPGASLLPAPAPTPDALRSVGASGNPSVSESRGLCSDSLNVGKVLFSGSHPYLISLKQVAIPGASPQETRPKENLGQKSCQQLATQHGNFLFHGRLP